MYLLFAVADLCVACDMPSLIPSSNINNISTSVNISSFTFVYFTKAVHASPGAKQTFLKFSNTSASNVVSSCT